MQAQDLVRELLLKWDENTSATPEQLCRPYGERPDLGELLQAVRKAIADLPAVSPFLAPSTDATTDPQRTTPHVALRAGLSLIRGDRSPLSLTV